MEKLLKDFQDQRLQVCNSRNPIINKIFML